MLHQDENVAQLFSTHLDSKLDPNNIPTNLDTLCQQISTSIAESVDVVCPKSIVSKSSPPWENEELQNLMAKLRKEPSNSTLQSEVRNKRKLLKQQFYSKKANEINCAAEARDVEKEFQLAKSYRMHKSSSSKIHISKEKLSKHFEKHFSERDLELPPELVNPDNFEYLKDSRTVVNEEPPTIEEIKEACKTFKNNKSFGTDNVPPEGVKYSSSNNLFYFSNNVTFSYMDAMCSA